MQRESFRMLVLEPLEQRHLLSLCIWSGASGIDQNWSTPTNWVGHAAPQAGDSLSFPSVGTGLSPVNDMTVASFVSIDISGSGYTLGGNAVTLQSGLTNEGSRNTVDLNLTLGASQEFDNNSGSTLTIGGTTVGNIDLGGYTLTIAGSGGETDLNGIISDTGDLIAASAAAELCWRAPIPTREPPKSAPAFWPSAMRRAWGTPMVRPTRARRWTAARL